MKVIFRSNDELAKKELGQLGGAEEWLSSLDKYVSKTAVARLSLFIDEGIALATLDIMDGIKHVHSSCKDENMLTAIQKVIKKCETQLKKSKYDFSNDTLRYNEEFNTTFESISKDIVINPETLIDFEFIELEEKLSKEKETSKYKKIMSKYINYLYRNNDIEHTNEHLRILYSIYNEVDKEQISVADYERLVDSINELATELEYMLEMQERFENNTKYNTYINYILEEETRLAKLKR